MNNYCVYYHRNTANDKLYIGISKDISKRWSANGNQYKECKFFYRAIQKYGWENFEHVILIDNISKEVACIIEKELIQKYNTQNKDFGYNLASGGFGGCTSKGQNHFLSKKVFQYDLNGVFIREWENAQRASEELGICVSDIHVMCRGANGIKKAGNFMWSYVKVDSMCPYVREGKSKETILQIDKNFNVVNEFKNISYIDITLFDREKITNCCKEKSITHKGYYWIYKKNYNQQLFPKYIQNRKKQKCYVMKSCKPIEQCDLDGNIIKVYSSSKQVEDETNLKRSTVQAYCKRPELNHGIHTGFIWRYA